MLKVWRVGGMFGDPRIPIGEHRIKGEVGLGDLVEAAAKPIATALKMNCLDEKKNLKPESPCAKRRDWLNNLTKPHDR